MMTATKEEKGGRKRPVTKCEIYNLADKGDTSNINRYSLSHFFYLADQGIMNDFIKEIFGISTGFQGTMISQLAKVNVDL